MRDIHSYVESYNSLPFEVEQVRFRRRLVLEQIKKYSPSSVLEVGCGMQPLFLDLPESIDVTIVEPSGFFIENAQVCAKKISRDVHFVKGFFESVGPLSTFDFIVVSSLLHEVEDPEGLLRSLQACCDENTVIHFNVPNARSLHRLLALEMGLIDDLYVVSDTQKEMQQFSTFDLTSMSNLLLNHGFVVLDQGSYFVKPFTHFQMQRLVEMGLVTDEMLEGFYGLVKHLPEYGSEIYINARFCYG